MYPYKTVAEAVQKLGEEWKDKIRSLFVPQVNRLKSDNAQLEEELGKMRKANEKLTNQLLLEQGENVAILF